MLSSLRTFAKAWTFPSLAANSASLANFLPQTKILSNNTVSLQSRDSAPAPVDCTTLQNPLHFPSSWEAHPTKSSCRDIVWSSVSSTDDGAADQPAVLHRWTAPHSTSGACTACPSRWLALPPPGLFWQASGLGPGRRLSKNSPKHDHSDAPADGESVKDLRRNRHYKTAGVGNSGTKEGKGGDKYKSS